MKFLQRHHPLPVVAQSPLQFKSWTQVTDPGEGGAPEAKKEKKRLFRKVTATRAGCCQEPSEVTSAPVRSGHPELRGDSVMSDLTGQRTAAVEREGYSEGSKLIDSLCSDLEPRDRAELEGEGRSGQACVNWEPLRHLCRLAGRACGGVGGSGGTVSLQVPLPRLPTRAKPAIP